MRPATLLWPRSGAALLGAGAALVNAAARVALVPLFVLPLFDRVLAGEVSALPGVVALTGAVVVAGALALWAQDALLGAAAARLGARWRERLYAALLRRAPGDLPGSSGGLTGRVLTDLREVESYYQYGLGSVVAETATIVGIVGYLFVTDPRATGLLLLFGLPAALGLQLVGRRLERAATGSQAATEELARHLQEGLRHHGLVRAFRADRALLARFAPANTRTRRAMTRRAVLAGLQLPLTQLLVFGALVLLVVMLVARVRQGLMSPGELVTYVTLVALLATPLQLLPKGLAMLVQARAAAARLLALLGPPDPIPPSGGRIPERGGFALAGVSADYGLGAVLTGVDLRLPERGLVVVHGESGAGKSTLLKLLLGFLEPGSGSVRYGGETLADLDETELRRRLGYVPQDSALLSGSLRENLLLGRGLPESALWSALDAVGLRSTVEALPAGLDHELGEDGGGLSGGQQQRLAVARALVSDPDALLLDEPTANLDADSERALIATLRQQAAERLVVAVAHRPALIEAADVALEVRGGRVLRARPLPSGSPP